MPTPVRFEPMLTSEAAAMRHFERSRKGYVRDEVEALRARVVVALTLTERGQAEGVPLGADDLIEVELGFGRGGYDHREVDRFIDEAAAVLRRRGVLRAGGAEPEASAISTDGLGRTFGGYDTDEVDGFVESVIKAIDLWEEGVRPDLTAGEVDRRTFGTRRRGYDHDSVEALVSRAMRVLDEFETANPLPDDPEDQAEPA